jgi:hypothetical protein
MRRNLIILLTLITAGIHFYFYATGDKNIPFAAAYRPGCQVDRSQSRGTQPVDRYACSFNGQPGKQGRHASYIPVIFTRLVRTAYVNFFNVCRVHLVPLQDSANDQGSQVIWPDSRQASTQCPHRGPNSIDNDRIIHKDILIFNVRRAWIELYYREWLNQSAHDKGTPQHNTMLVVNAIGGPVMGWSTQHGLLSGPERSNFTPFSLRLPHKNG